MNTVDDRAAESGMISGTRRFRSPNRILARSFRISRDKWKARHHAVRAELKQSRRLAAERGASRDRWKAECQRETARALAAEAMVERLKSELEQARARIAAMEGAQKKSAPNDVLAAALPKRGSTPLGIVDGCVRLVTQAGVAMRAVPRVLTILFGMPGPTDSLPGASSIRSWLQRLGLFTLHESIEHADDWVWLVDHSVQLGEMKVCVVLGLRLSESPLPERALRHEDVRTLAIVPVKTSTGEIVAGQLEDVAKRTGIPRVIVSDRGGDVKKGGELFRARHPGVALIYDAAHRGASLLKRRLESDERWSEFVGLLGQTKSRTQQTADAHLLAPSLRPKARYMNLRSLLKWSRRLLAILDRGEGGGVATARAEARYGWLRAFRESIGTWSRCEATVRCGVEFVRTQGHSIAATDELAIRLESLLAGERDDALAAELLEFVRVQSASARPGERLVGSTEVLESLFGKWKHLERQESQSGMTGFVLSLGVIAGKWPLSRIQAALESTPVKHVEVWCKQYFPTTLQSQRRLAFSPTLP